jgi:hypothetical protein
VSSGALQRGLCSDLGFMRSERGRLDIQSAGKFVKGEARVEEGGGQRDGIDRHAATSWLARGHVAEAQPPRSGEQAQSRPRSRDGLGKKSEG